MEGEVEKSLTPLEIKELVEGALPKNKILMISYDEEAKSFNVIQTPNITVSQIHTSLTTGNPLLSGPILDRISVQDLGEIKVYNLLEFVRWVRTEPYKILNLPGIIANMTEQKFVQATKVYLDVLVELAKFETALVVDLEFREFLITNKPIFQWASLLLLGGISLANLSTPLYTATKVAGVFYHDIAKAKESCIDGVLNLFDYFDILNRVQDEEWSGPTKWGGVPLRPKAELMPALQNSVDPINFSLLLHKEVQNLHSKNKQICSTDRPAVLTQVLERLDSLTLTLINNTLIH